MPKSLYDKIFHPSHKKRQEHEWRRLRRQYERNADPRRIDIDWSQTNFNRVAVVNLLLAHQPDARYLEIGCDRNELFDAVIAKNKTGVDPARGGTHRLTSDEFFQHNNGARYDVAFIDGLHLYEQAHRDVVNALRCVGAGGWIGLHDMFPRDWMEEHIPRLSLGWTGDVWKVAFELARSPHIEFKLLKIDRGVGVARVLRDGAQISDRSTELADKRFPYFFDHAAELPILEYEAGRTWLEQSLRMARLQAQV